MKIVDIASNIWLLELGEPTDVSVAAIAQKLRTSIGKLNNLLNTTFYINDSTFEIINGDDGSEITEEQVDIFNYLYLEYYYGKQSQSFLGANGIDQVKSINQDGIIVQLLDRNQISKSYLELKKQNKENLRQALNSYKQNRATPRQVVGDDTLTNIGNPIINPVTKATYPDISSNRDRRY